MNFFLMILFLFEVPLVLSASNKMLCEYCHQNKLEVASLQSKEEWKKLTSDGGIRLKEIHQYNLGVIAYLQSKEYNQKKLYDYVEFHADSKHEVVVKKIMNTCVKCHGGKINLSSLWSKDQWDNLLKSTEYLEKIHQNELKVVALMESEQFKNYVPEFVEDVRFHAEDLKRDKNTIGIYSYENYKEIKLEKFQFKDQNIVFNYEKMDGQREEAEKIYLRMKQIFKKCQIDMPITFKLSESGWKMNGGDVFIWVLTFSLADIRSTITLTLEATQEGKTYMSEEKIIHTDSWFKNHSQRETSFMVLDKLVADIIKQIGLECKR